ncbi:MAG TPA: hypothetical protein VH251_11140 [Verrucomicrobiae bacterium]|jgi:hypothetical protein|nr:hypothetical protein [Verrucomicrobiae bacterium]
MSELMDKILAAKLAERKRIVALPIEEKFAILEKLRDLTYSIQQSRAGVPVSQDRKADDGERH